MHKTGTCKYWHPQSEPYPSEKAPSKKPYHGSKNGSSTHNGKRSEPCRHGDKCIMFKKGTCRFLHEPKPAEPEEPTKKLAPTKVCKFGDDCERIKNSLVCHYWHPKDPIPKQGIRPVDGVYNRSAAPSFECRGGCDPSSCIGWHKGEHLPSGVTYASKLHVPTEAATPSSNAASSSNATRNSPSKFPNRQQEDTYIALVHDLGEAAFRQMEHHVLNYWRTHSKYPPPNNISDVIDYYVRSLNVPPEIAGIMAGIRRNRNYLQHRKTDESLRPVRGVPYDDLARLHAYAEYSASKQ